MVYLEVGRHALGAKPAFINGEIVTWLDADNMVLLNQQVHAALYSAVGTVGRHHAIDYSICTPTVVGRVMKVRTKCLNDLIQIFDSTHRFSVAREP